MSIRNKDYLPKASLMLAMSQPKHLQMTLDWVNLEAEAT